MNLLSLLVGIAAWAIAPVFGLPVTHISTGLKAQSADTASSTDHTHQLHCGDAAIFLPDQRPQGANASEICIYNYNKYKPSTSIPSPVYFSSPVSTTVLTSMLDATQQTHHTMTQLDNTLLSLLSKSGSCTSSVPTPTECGHLTCSSQFQPELTLACNTEQLVLPRLANLAVLLRNEIPCSTCLQDVKYVDIDPVNSLADMRLYGVIATYYAKVQTESIYSAL